MKLDRIGIILMGLSLASCALVENDMEAINRQASNHYYESSRPVRNTNTYYAPLQPSREPIIHNQLQVTQYNHYNNNSRQIVHADPARRRTAYQAQQQQDNARAVQQHARQGQIANDEAMARRLQAEEHAAVQQQAITQEHGQGQIANDEAMARRLQAEEYARAVQEEAMTQEHARQRQIADDEAMARRLQAEEYGQ
jgi:hypothetical protein